MSRAQNLYQLQELDNEKAAIRKRLAQIKSALGETAAQRRARKTVEAANKEARQMSARQQDLELQVSTLRKKITDSEKRLYNGSIRNPKELSDRQAELASLRRRLENLEEKLLETMIEREAAEESAEEAQAHLAQVDEEWERSQESLLAEKKELEARAKETGEARSDLLPAISAGDLKTYRSLRKAKGERAIAPVSGETCTGCWMQLTPNRLSLVRRGGELIFCDNCERILLSEE